MAEKKKTKLTDTYPYGQEPTDSAPKGAISNARLQDVGGKPKLAEMSKAETMIGGYDLKGGSKTESLPRTIEMQKTKEAGQALADQITAAAIERMKKKKLP
jgi:hypothetical protein